MLKATEARLKSGSLLTEAQYTALAAAEGSLAYDVVLEQYGPKWNVLAGAVPPVDAQCLDGCIAGGYSVVVYLSGGVWYAKKLAPGATAWTTVPWTDSTATEKIPPWENPVSITSDGTSVSVFFYSHFGVRKITCADISSPSASFGDSSLVMEIMKVEKLAFVDPLTGYGCYTSSENNHVMFKLAYSGGGVWTKTDSDVYWPFPINSLDSASLPDRDVVGLSCDLPPLWGTSLVGTTAQQEFNRVQGIVFFTVRNNHWSDYRVHDIIDRDVYGYGRTNFRFISANGYLFATYLRYMVFRHKAKNGEALVASDPSRLFTVVSRSKDAVNWDYSEIIAGAGSPAHLLPASGDLALAYPGGTAKSALCSWAGYSSPASQDVTSFILDLRSQAGDARSTSVELANPYVTIDEVTSQKLSGTLVDDSEARQMLRVYLGFHV